MALLSKTAAAALSLGILLWSRVDAQTPSPPDSDGILRGKLVGTLQEPLEAARLSVDGGRLSVSSAADGSFLLRGLPRTVFLVSVVRIGFNPQLLRVDLSRSRDWVGTIQMSPGQQRLPEVSVTVRAAKPAEYAYTAKYDDVFRRLRLGLGTFISRDEIERRAAIRTAQLLQGIPGARADIRPQGDADPTRITFARCHELPPKISVWIDGHKLIPEHIDGDILTSRIFDPNAEQLKRTAAYQNMLRLAQGLVGEMLDRIAPSQIEMVEVFRGPSEIPAEFKDDSCAAIVIWTR